MIWAVREGDPGDPPGQRPPGRGRPGLAVICLRCGHDADKHQHLRPGTDCSLCSCPRLRRPTVLGRLLNRLGR